jgi:2-C-methyl-D-erythritol 4-phosphate cytidylyltransferase
MDGRVGVVVVAAGESRRMRGIDKVFVQVLGGPLIVHAVRPFETHPSVDEIVLVTAASKVPAMETLARNEKWRKVKSVCVGGNQRQDSVWRGVERLDGCEWVLVHDGARPCVDAQIIDRGLDAVCITGAAIACVPVKDTVKVVSQERRVQATPPRESLWAVQTPQVFRAELLREAHLRCSDYVTDDAALVERLGREVLVFMGSYENIKVTTPEDLLFVEAILRKRLEETN